MGWGRMLLLGNVGQQLDIQDTRRAVGQIAADLRANRQRAHDVACDLDQLAAENAELKLYLAAIVRLLVAKGAITSVELSQLVDELDRTDGRPDGRYDGPIAPG